MKLPNTQSSRSAQSWDKRVERRHPPKGGYHSELRSWVQHVILKAEKNKNFENKGQFLDLLKILTLARLIARL